MHIRRVDECVLTLYPTNGNKFLADLCDTRASNPSGVQLSPYSSFADFRCQRKNVTKQRGGVASAEVPLEKQSASNNKIPHPQMAIILPVSGAQYYTLVF